MPIRFGIFSPGSPPRPEGFERGLRWLGDRGFAYTLGGSARPGEGIHAGPAEQRAEEFHRLLRDPQVGAILCTRGGSGTLGLLPHLDYELAARVRKPVIGMSDVTALHLALFQRRRLAGISGPMVVQLSAESPAYTIESWRALVDGAPSEHAIPLPEGPPPRRLSDPSGTSTAEGVLFPCNISLLVALIGTPYLPSLAGAILVLEDIQETPQSLDRMVSQLRLSGVADGLAGIVLGQFTDCLPHGPGVREEEGRTLLEEWAGSLGVPSLAGFPYGHEALTCSLPFGTRVRLTVDPPSLSLTEIPPAPLSPGQHGADA